MVRVPLCVHAVPIVSNLFREREQPATRQTLVLERADCVKPWLGDGQPETDSVPRHGSSGIVALGQAVIAAVERTVAELGGLAIEWLWRGTGRPASKLSWTETWSA